MFLPWGGTFFVLNNVPHPGRNSFGDNVSFRVLGFVLNSIIFEFRNS